MAQNYILSIVLIVFIAHYCSSAPKTTEEVLKELNSGEVIPDVIDTTDEIACIKVTYGTKKKVNFGNSLTVSESSKQPKISWPADEEDTYTLMMVDPDAPSKAKPTNREWLHWIMINIKGSDISTGTVLTPYRGPSPPKGTGQHRYVFLVYKQQSELNLGQILSRPKFNARKFAKDNQLGNPIAANYFRTENK